MKCQQCEADTKILETRVFQEIFAKRRHECFNGHRFWTYEVTEEYLDLKKFVKDTPGVEIDAAAILERRPPKLTETGVPGVYWRKHPTGGYYHIELRRGGKAIHLGNTRDFFEACCKRKSYEAMFAAEEDLT